MEKSANNVFCFKSRSIPFLKRKSYNHIHSILISTDNFLFWKKCSFYAYQTQSPPPFLMKETFQWCVM